MARQYYNGVLLPEIPESILNEYPYIWIRRDSTYGNRWDLACAKQPYYKGSSGKLITKGAEVWYTIPLSTTITDEITWNYYQSYSSGDDWNLDSGRIFIWTNNIIYQDSVDSSTIYAPKCATYPYTNKKLKYNEVILPPIPTEHFATNPFVFIRKDETNGYYDLVLSTNQMYYSNDRIQANTQNSQYWYRIPILNSSDYDTWEFNEEGTNYWIIDNERTVLWSLQDISNEQNSASVYFSSTVPITITISIKYLIQSDNTLYTIENNELKALEVTELTSETFKTYGSDTAPTFDILNAFTKPKIYCWTDDTQQHALTASVKATPKPQTVITNDIDLSDPSITGIEKVTAEYTGDPHVACSFDGGTTWKLYNGVAWVVLSEAETGMTLETLLAITTENWTTVIEGLNSFRMRFTLTATDDTVTNIVINFTN